MVSKVLVSMEDNSVKNSCIEILKPHAHLHIIGRKSTKFQVNPMKDVGGVAETRSWLSKVKSEWAITPSKIVESNSKTTCTSSYHRKKVYKISSESDERYRRICGDKISRTAGRTDGKTDGITHTWTDEGHFYSPPSAYVGCQRNCQLLFG